MTTAVEVFDRSLVDDTAPLVLRYVRGGTRTLAVDVWTAQAVSGDAGMLDRCVGATLDVGCGPGRLTVALARRGLPALGVDIAPGALRLARARGALVLPRSVFGVIPGHGHWDTVLLADGNIGIGGDPVGLLVRVRELLGPHGRVVLELDPPGSRHGAQRVRIEHGDHCSDWFGWAHAAAEHVRSLAAAASLRIGEQWQESGRWFAVLERE